MKQPRYLSFEPDRYGAPRWYARVKGKPKIRIHARYGSPEFWTEHAAAVVKLLSGTVSDEPVRRGSFRALCILYYASPSFTLLDKKTKGWRRHALDLIAHKHGALPVAQMRAKHVRGFRDALQATPAASLALLKALRALFRWAAEAEHVESDPTIGVTAIRYASSGHHPWLLDEIERYKNRHPIGTPARLAFALAYYTMGRREDVARLGPQHIRNGCVRFRCAKNEHRNPHDADMELHPELAKAIDAAPTQHLTFMTWNGKPYSPGGLTRAFRRWCDEAGLPPHCSLHGLRKAALTSIAEEGGSTHELAAAGGHRTLGQVENYTKTASRSKLADAAIARLK
jgi:integrase